ncbi:alpha/beta hydrolase [Peptidiphaga gingivicola]|uniref:Alpha/beta hydrolase n=1 Tax=Peptidiphaga gingivicola TaxID=2741497 RepID=A0A179B517_9ACTO|nr:alpha/beta hydrolase [Peptidiphaga gingivicola]OAP86786.1 alpha/beta hydrolase [Peptidiphaga gingivicola]
MSAGKAILAACAAAVATGVFVPVLRLKRAVKDAEGRLEDCAAETAMLSYGKMTYVDCGPSCKASDGMCLSDEKPSGKGSSGNGLEGKEPSGKGLDDKTSGGNGLDGKELDGKGRSDQAAGETLLSVHGLYGGYDQALENVGSLSSRYRILAPSRFGYPGSSVKGEGTPKEQAEAYVELLDLLGIERVFILGASAGGTPAIRFVLDFPERAKGLILYCSTAPWNEKPAKIPGLMGPPPIMNHDLSMWLAFPIYRRLYGMEADVVHRMLPLSKRKEGADLDARIVNRDMAVNFEAYPIEEMHVPVLLLHAKDDRMAPFKGPAGQVEGSLHRYPNLETKIFETGGHLMTGHSREIDAAVVEFIERHKQGG